MRAPESLTTPHVQGLLDQCIHCGLCLPACPTYSIFQTEMDGPRGRIALMRAASQGRASLDGAVREHIELCLGCRACETACPSGVHYGALLELTRQAVEEERQVSPAERGLRWLALRQLMPHRGRLRLLARLLRAYQLSGAPRLVQRLGWLPPSLRTMAALLPPLSLRYPAYAEAAPALGAKQGEVAFLYGCVQDAFLTEVNAASVRVLQRNGFEVHFPAQQSCCGAAALHIGERGLAAELARRNIDACSGREYAAIISNAGGCGATLKDYAHLLADDPVYAARARAFVDKVRDINEFLVDHLRTPPRHPLQLRVTYVESCHLRHAQRVVREPRQLLAAIPGVTLVELRQPDQCCGSAGVYNILQTEAAEQVLDAKLADVAATGADVVVCTNTGCHMQMIHGVRKAGLVVEVVHLVELLDRAYTHGD